MKKEPIVYNKKQCCRPGNVIPKKGHQGSFDPMEGYGTRGCDLGKTLHFAAVSTSPALRTILFSNGEGMLGSYPNPHSMVH